MAEASTIRFRLVPPPAIRFRLGLSATIAARPGLPPAPVFVLIGPKGADGNTGPPGPGIGDYDPGDLTLDFYNALI